MSETTQASASRSRRVARVCAFQALYMIEVGGADGPSAIEAVLEVQPLADPALGFAKQEVEGVWINQRDLDQTVEKFLAHGWALDRLAVTDRIALSLAAYEIYHLPGIPPKVTITEAVNLAKRFGTKESGRFVNGVLASLLAASPKADWDPAMEEAMPDETGDEPEGAAEEEEEIEEGTREHQEILRAGAWVVKSEH